MLFRQIYPLIAVFLFNTVCLGREYSFPVLSQQSPECNPLHWRHHATNSAVEIEGIDKQADGGCHVNSLNEIGTVEIVKVENKGKNNRRIYYYVKG